MPVKLPHSIKHILLDIEGTTCPVMFVREVLFPYAARQLLPFLIKHQTEQSIQNLLAEVHQAWKQDKHPEAITLAETIAAFDERAVLSAEEAHLYLIWLIRQDRKLTSLKDLQGMIWEEGYRTGDLLAPVFADVPEAIRGWHEKGIHLSVYSSGSIQAQKLLYSHTSSGDLSPFFSYWFDTRTGPKQEAASYLSIANTLKTKSEQVLFISDSPAELKAARETQMIVLFSNRPGNAAVDNRIFNEIQDFRNLEIEST